MNLEVRNAQFSYDKTNVVFRDVNFSLSEGDVLCLLGPNGCGKTTLVKCMDGLLPLKEGEIRLNGVNIKSLDRTTIAKNLGYMPQTHSPTFPFSVRDVVLTGRASHISQWSSPSKFDVELADHIMETLGIFHLARRPHTQVSDGERKLVCYLPEY